MIVSHKVIPNNILSASVNNLSGLSRRMVPKYIDKLPALVNNTSYYLAVKIRHLESIPFATRKKAEEECLSKVYTLKGIANVLVDIDDIFRLVSMNKVLQKKFGAEDTAKTEIELHQEIEGLLDGILGQGRHSPLNW